MKILSIMLAVFLSSCATYEYVNSDPVKSDSRSALGWDKTECDHAAKNLASGDGILGGAFNPKIRPQTNASNLTWNTWNRQLAVYEQHYYHCMNSKGWDRKQIGGW